MPPMGVTLAEAQEVLGREKVLHTDMRWSAQRGKMQFQWVQSRIILEYADDMALPEDLYVHCQWQKRVKSIPERWTFSVMHNGCRIYAIDVNPVSRHGNYKAGKGRRLYGQEIDGVHEHTWSKEGYGYAEPIELPLDRPDIIWQIFLKHANIGRGDFFHPDHNQPELDL